MPRQSRSSKEPSTSNRTRNKRALIRSSSEDSDSMEVSFDRPLKSSTQVRTQKTAATSPDLTCEVNNMVKYLLNHLAPKIPIKRADIYKSLNIPPKQFPEIFAACSVKLREIYGLEVSEVEEKSANMYILYSAFPVGVTIDQFTPEHRHEITLLFLVLSYIFMKGGEVQEVHLTQFLEQIGISCNESDTTFGEVGKLIRETFPRQLYLKRTKKEIEGVNEAQLLVEWGFRAKKEFDKKQMLKSVAELLNKSPTSFVNQHIAAFGENANAINPILIDDD